MESGEIDCFVIYSCGFYYLFFNATMDQHVSSREAWDGRRKP